MAALAALVLTVSAAALYSFGIAYWNTYLNTLGFGPGQFPVDSYELVFYGGVFGYLPASQSLLYFLGGLLVYPFVSRFAWLGKARDLMMPSNTAKPISWLLMPMWVWFLWTYVQDHNVLNARRSAENTMQQIRENPCGNGEGPKAGLALTLVNGTAVPVAGVRIVCTERFCGLHDGKHPIVVSLEGVRSMRIERPAECRPHRWEAQ
jgi:hypothetical protein